MGEKLFYLFRSHSLRMALLVEEDETSDPIGVRLFSAEAEVAQSGDGADAVEELRLLHGLGVSGGKGLKALAGAGIIHAWRRTGRERFGFCSPITELGRNIRQLPPHYGVRPHDSAFHEIGRAS